jgi:hypothetical protein
MREFSYQDRITMSARLAAGAMFVAAEPRDTAAVDIQPYDDSSASRDAAEQTVVEMRGDTLHIESPDRGWRLRRSGRLRVDVRLPEDSRLIVKLASADGRFDGRFGDSRFDTASGDISVEHVAGTLTVHSASGDVRVGQIDGPASVSTASGDIVVGHSATDVVMDTASGDITVERAGGSVRATTASGDLRVDGVSRGSVALSTSSGDVRIGVAAGTSVWLDLSTASGRTRSDLDHGEGPPAGGAADVNVRVRTASGDIELRRVPVAADA